MLKEQKVAIITGAGRGIGAALTDAYRGRNYLVVANSLSIEPSNDEGIVTVRGDIGDRKTAAHVVDEAMARFGRIDTLINNAGSSSASRSANIPSMTTTRCWPSISAASFILRSLSCRRWRDMAMAI